MAVAAADTVPIDDEIAVTGAVGALYRIASDMKLWASYTGIFNQISERPAVGQVYHAEPRTVLGSLSFTYGARRSRA